MLRVELEHRCRECCEHQCCCCFCFSWNEKFRDHGCVSDDWTGFDYMWKLISWNRLSKSKTPIDSTERKKHCFSVRGRHCFFVPKRHWSGLFLLGVRPHSRCVGVSNQCCHYYCCCCCFSDTYSVRYQSLEGSWLLRIDLINYIYPETRPMDPRRKRSEIEDCYSFFFFFFVFSNFGRDSFIHSFILASFVRRLSRDRPYAIFIMDWQILFLKLWSVRRHSLESRFHTRNHRGSGSCSCCFVIRLVLFL